MALIIKDNSVFVFDLDDTLYQEEDFLKSGYKSIAEEILPITNDNIYDEMMSLHRKGEKVFEWIASAYSNSSNKLSESYLLSVYRNHLPKIKMTEGARRFLKNLSKRNIPLGLITDGRRISQRNKLKVLEIENYFEHIIISEEFGSEKSNEKNFLFFEKKYPGKNFIYIGDNTNKDFIVPSKLGWGTICLKDSGKNIHTQIFDRMMDIDLIVNSFEELNSFFNF